MYKICTGYDLHRLKKQKHGTIICGGQQILCDLVLHGAHSDGDVVFHALTDALLSVKHTDIGQLFPNTDPNNKDRNSQEFLRIAYGLMKNEYTICNIDIIIICDTPKISPYCLDIRKNISKILNLPMDDISIKGKTTEHTRINTIESYTSLLIQKISKKISI